MLKSVRLRILIIIMCLALLLLIGVAYVSQLQSDDTDLVALPTVAQLPTNAPVVDGAVEFMPNVDTPRSDSMADTSDRQPTDFVLPTRLIERTQLATSERPEPSVIDRPDIAPRVLANNERDSQPIALPTDNQVIVRFRADASQQARADYVTSIGGTVVQTIEALSSVVVTVPDDIDITTLPESEIVVEREPEQYVTALSDVRVPTNDPHYPEQWAFDALAIGEVWANLPNSLPDVTVATVDSGICLSHPDLDGRIGAGYDFVDDDTTPQDGYNHGCGVAGIIAAHADNAVGIAGIAPNVTLMPLRVLDENGIGTYSDVAQAIIYAVDNGADIINLSLGGANPSSTLADAVAYADTRGVQLVAAAGNRGHIAPLYPAAYAGVISVGASDNEGNRTAFSNHNADIQAPGENIITLSADGTHATRSGTSYAAAHITALLALDSLTINADTVATADTESQIETNTSGGTVTAASVVEVSPCVYEVGDAGDGAQTALDDALSDGDSLESAALTVQGLQGTCATVELILFAGEQYLVDAVQTGTDSLIEVDGIDVIVRTETTGSTPAVIERDGTAPNFRFFNVVNATDALTLQDLELKNGRVSGVGFVDGGAILSNGNLTITSVDFINNIAISTDSDSYGGAIASKDGTLTLSSTLTTDSIFASNQADAGGAIVFEGDQLVIDDATFDNNTALLSGALAVYAPENVNIPSVADGTDAYVDIANSTFTNNTANDAGAIHIIVLSTPALRVEIESTTFEDNTASNPAGTFNDVGGLILINVETLITNSTFRGNIADTNTNNASLGGALFISNNYTVDRPVTIRNTLFEQNSADAGGAVSISSFSGILFDTVTFRDNTANNDGGAVHTNATSQSNIEFRNSIFEGNTATTGSGGAIFSIDSELTISETDFTGNSAFNEGGAIYFEIDNFNSNLTIADATFENNQTTTEDYGSGGAILAWSRNGQSSITNTVTIDRTLFEGNTTIGEGGAVFIASLGYDFDDVTFRGNLATTNPEGDTSSAGALHILLIWDSNVPTIVENSLFENNASDFGGAVVIYSYADTLFDQVDFVNNTGNGGGGAVAIVPAEPTFEFGSVEFRRSSFDGNVANADVPSFDSLGGAIFSRDVDLVVSQSTSFTNNTAIDRGGAIYFWIQTYTSEPEKTLTISDTSFTGNSTTANGGAIDLDNSFGNASATIANSTFTSNESSFGGALFSDDTALSVTDTDFTNNIALSGGAVVLSDEQATDRNADFTNVTFEGNTANRDNFIFGDGGAIYIQDVTTTFTDTNFIDNISENQGGAVALLNVNTLDGMTLTRTTFTGNTSESGGGIFVVPADTTAGLIPVQISDSAFSGNSAPIASAVGGGFVDLLINNTDFTANIANFGIGAGAVGVDSGNVVVTNSRFIDNVASDGSAFNVENSTGRFNNNCIVGNSDNAVTASLDNPPPLFDATLNWWGEAAGASNAGNGIWADSASGDIDVSNPLTTAPIDCPNATPATDNYLTGTITNNDGIPLPSMLVTAVDYNGGGWFVETCTNQFGQYVIEDLPANTDIVVQAGGATVNQECGGSDAYMTEFYADETVPYGSIYTQFDATILQPQGSIFSDIDIELGIAGIITVTVEDESNSQPIQHITVRSEWLSPRLNVLSYCTDVNGEATIRVPLGVASTVDASADEDRCGQTPAPYVWEYYADVYDPRIADTITLTETTPTEAITMQLALGGIITGTVTDTSGQSVVNAGVSASSFDNTFPENTIESTYGGDLTDGTGAYTVYGVPFDTPIILHTDSNTYGIEFWQDSSMSIDATPVTLTSGAPQQTINFVLQGSVGVITGTIYDADGVTPLAGVPVRVVGAPWYNGQNACTDSGGRYGLFNVNVGSEYIIAAGGIATGIFDGSCANEAEPLVFYNQQFDFATATRLTLTEDTTTGIDFVLTAESFSTTVDNANVSTDEGSEVTNGGTYSNVAPNDLAISASVGTAVNNNDGTWSWSYTPTDGPAESQTVMLTLDETTSSRQATIEFDLVVNNVAPTGTLTFAQGLQPNTPIELFFQSVNDVSSVDAAQLSNFTYDIDCDTDGNYEATSISVANAPMTCTYATAGAYTVTGILRDKDGGELTETLAITIAEINAPTLLSAIYGNSDTDVALSLSGALNETYDVSFYSVASCDVVTPTLLTTTSVLTDGTGSFDDTVTLTGITLTPDMRIVMQAERVLSLDTSAFSDCPLATPTNLSGTSTQVSFSLAWENNDSDQTSVELEVSTNGGSTWSLLQTLDNDAISATVDNLQCGTALSFRVRGVDGTQNRVSAYSNVFSGSTIACPPNDAVANATVFTNVPFTDSQPTLGAISEVGDPQPACGTSVGNSIWYSFTPSSSGTYQFTTIGSDYDAVLAVYTGSIGSLSEFACDKDSAPSTQALLNLPLTSGVTYRILVGANNGQGGDAVFTVRNLLAPTATPIPTNTPVPTTAPDPVLTTVGLFDADLGLWQFRDSNTGGFADVAFNWGMDGVGWVGVVGDWNGDGIDGIGMYRDGLWLLRDTATVGNANMEVRFGEAGWQPVVGDWNGDGTDNVGVYRDGQFMLSVNGTVQMVSFDLLGQGGTPLAGDWDGINGDTVGLYNAGVWALADSNVSNTSVNVFSYGEPNWLPVVGDWNEDGIDSIGGYRNGRWYLRNSNNAGAPDVAFAFGEVGNPLTSYRGGAPALTALSDNLVAQPTAEPATATDSPSLTPVPSVTPTAMPSATSEQDTDMPEATPEATENIP